MVTPKRKWILMTAIVSVLVVVAGWFLVISPARAQASQLREQADTQATANQQLQISIAQLRREAQELQAQQKRLKEMEGRIPEKVQLSAVVRQIATTVRGTGAQVTSFTPTQPQPLTTKTPASAPSASEAQPDTPDGAATSTTSGQTRQAAASATTLFMVPLSLTVQGNFGQLQKILKGFEAYQRVFLVTASSIEVVADEQGNKSGEALTMMVTGRIFTRTNEFAPALAAAQAATTTSSTTTGKGLG